MGSSEATVKIHQITYSALKFWLQYRAGKITASEFATCMKTLDWKVKQNTTYPNELEETFERLLAEQFLNSIS